MSGWASSRLDWLVTEKRRTVNPLSVTSDVVFHYSIPVLEELGDGQLEPANEIGSDKLLLEGGEVLISKLNPRLTRVVRAKAHDVPTLASTEFIALRPGPDADPRFLCYWLESESTRQFLNGATMSVTRSQQRVRPDVLTKTWVSFPLRSAQQAIADFLDAETARVDALITKKRRVLALLHERLQSAAEKWIRSKRHVALRRVADLLPGYTFPSRAFSPDYSGKRLLRGINVGVGAIRWHDCVRVPAKLDRA